MRQPQRGDRVARFRVVEGRRLEIEYGEVSEVVHMEGSMDLPDTLKVRVTSLITQPPPFGVPPQVVDRRYESWAGAWVGEWEGHNRAGGPCWCDTPVEDYPVDLQHETAADPLDPGQEP